MPTVVQQKPKKNIKKVKIDVKIKTTKNTKLQKNKKKTKKIKTNGQNQAAFE